MGSGGIRRPSGCGAAVLRCVRPARFGGDVLGVGRQIPHLQKNFAC
jgi:hypothetical protein